jgi:pimeloyl-ACP methyl ester carboxylesterase
MSEPPGARLSRVEVAGGEIAYREAGEGPALVLLHGFLCDSRCWRTQLAGLSSEFRVVAWDAPGAGASEDPPDTFTMGDWAHSLAGFLDALRISKAHVLGLSWGRHPRAGALSPGPAARFSADPRRYLRGVERIVARIGRRTADGEV